MVRKPTYEELEQRVKEFDEEVIKHKQAKEALRESEEKYRNLFENSTVGIDIATKSGKILESNNTMQKMM